MMKKLLVLLSTGILFWANMSYSLTTQSKIYYEVVNVSSYDVLNVRESYHHRSKKLSEISPFEQCVAYLNKSHKNWTMVSYNGVTGWVNSYYLRKNSQCKHTVMTKHYDVVRVAYNDVLNIRQFSNYSSKKIGEIPPNGICIAYLNKSRNNWVMVKYQGVIGWVNSRYLKKNEYCNQRPKITNDLTLDKLARQAAQKHRVDTSLVFAIIQQESAWDPNAVSRTGAIGVMQIMPSTGRDACGLSRRELFNPKKNIDCGVRYIKRQLRDFDQSIKLALCAYNAGPEKAKKGLKRCNKINETRNYIRKIIAILNNER